MIINFKYNKKTLISARANVSHATLMQVGQEVTFEGIAYSITYIAWEINKRKREGLVFPYNLDLAVWLKNDSIDRQGTADKKPVTKTGIATPLKQTNSQTSRSGSGNNK